ncbi:MAG TPA: ABC transporter permease [Gemmatimonadales bacterium]
MRVLSDLVFRLRALSPEAALREARRRFGAEVAHREGVREAWGIGVVTDLWADGWHALRQLRRHPGFAGVSILTLALGIGATVALASVVQGLMLRPLPFPDEDRLVVFWSQFDWRGVEFDFVAERAGAYEGIAAYTTNAVTYHSGSGTSLLQNALVSADMFDVLEARPILGRTLQPGEDRPGAEPVVVIGYGMWQGDFGADPNVVGRRIPLGGEPTTVIGVMGPDFYFPTPECRAWRPLVLDRDSQNYRGNGYLTLVGRLRDGITDAGVQADLGTLAVALGERFTYPAAWDKTRGAHVIPFREYVLGDVEPALLLLLGAVGLILVMTCTNAAALILARTSDRTSEIAVRTALGAGRGRVARQVLAESIVLALVAGTLGAVLAQSVFGILVASLPLTGGYASAVAFPWTGFAAAFLLALVVAFVVALAPMTSLFRGRLGSLRGSRSDAGLQRRTGRMQGILVTAEVVLALTLATGAALLVRSVARMQAIEIGLDPENVVTLNLVAGEAEMDETARRGFFAEAVQQAEALPGVRAAALVNRLPIRDGGWQGPANIRSRPDIDRSERPNAVWRSATPHYFDVMGMTIVQGRAFTDTDRAGAVDVAIVSESFARFAWPGDDPIGKLVSGTFEQEGQWRTVVGVAAETRMFDLTGENPFAMYAPFAQAPTAGISQVLVLQGERNATSLIPGVRAMIGGLDDRIAVSRAGPMEDVVAAAMAEPLRLRFYLMLFAGLGLVLSAVGVYGVVSYAVTRRRSEFGIRMALGATAGAILTDVVRRGVVPVGVGVIAGAVVSLALGNVISRFLYGVAPRDPGSLVVAAAVLFGTGIVAAVVPAWRAGRVNPVEALRAE